MSGSQARAKGTRPTDGVVSRGLRKGEWLAFCCIFGVATLLRIAYALQSRQSPFFDQLDLDSRFYDLWAKKIARGNWIGDDVFFMGPLYPYFLATIYSLFGPNLLGVRLIQSVLGGFTAGFTFLLGRECFNATVGLIAGCLVALYVPFIFYDNAILFPVLAAFLNTIMLYMLCRGVTRREKVAFLLGGLFCGLSAAGNASVLAYVPFVAIFLLKYGHIKLGAKVRSLALVVAGIAIVVLPITIRNYVIGKDFVPLTSNAGLNLYIGNNLRSTGAYVKPEGLDIYSDPSGRTIAEAALGRKLKPSEVSSYWTGRALEFIKTHPRDFLGNLVRKFFFFWSVYEIPQIEHLEFEKRFSWILRLPAPSFGIICPLGIVGIGIALRRRRRAWLLFLFIAVYSLTIIAFFVVARYRLPMIPALMTFAGYSIYYFTQTDRRELVKKLILLGALFTVVHINFFGIDPHSGYAQSHYRLGLAYEKKGNYRAAIESYRKATQMDPKLKAAYLNLGILLSRLGRYDQAKQPILEAIRLDSTYAKAYYDLGLVYAEEANLDSALAMFERALKIEPGYDLALLGRASALYEMGRLEEANELLSGLRRKASLEPASLKQVRALLRLIPERKAWLESRKLEYQRLSDRFLLRGDDLLAIGLIDRARKAYQRAIGADEHSAPALYQLGTIYLRAGQIRQAETYFKKAIASDPSIKFAHLALGGIALRRGDFEKACKEFEAELGVNPDSPQAHINLAMCYEEHLGILRKAAYHLRKYIELTGGTQELRRHLKEIERRLQNEG